MRRLLLGSLLSLLALPALAAGPAAPTNVSAAVSGTSVTVTWTPPVKNTDGSALTISGYNIYLASTDAALSALSTISTPKVGGNVLNSGTMAKYVLTGLAAGTYYLDMTSWSCVTTPCAPVSPFSNHVSFTIGSTATLGSATVSWTAPTTNSDGTPLTDLDHYNVYRGSSCSNIVSIAKVPAPTVKFTDTGLIVGNWCYAVTSVNAAAGESVKSGTVVITLSPPQPVPKVPGAPGKPTATCTVVAPQGMTATCSVTP